MDCGSLLKVNDANEGVVPPQEASNGLAPPQDAIDGLVLLQQSQTTASNPFANAMATTVGGEIAVPAEHRPELATPKCRWSADEDTLIIKLRSTHMKWSDISKQLPGRTAVSCRLRYQNFLGKMHWDGDRQTRLAYLYERYKSDMWAKVAQELHVPWQAAETMHWELGRDGMADLARTLRPSGPSHTQDESYTQDGGVVAAYPQYQQYPQCPAPPPSPDLQVAANPQHPQHPAPSPSLGLQMADAAQLPGLGELGLDQYLAPNPPPRPALGA